MTEQVTIENLMNTFEECKQMLSPREINLMRKKLIYYIMENDSNFLTNEILLRLLGEEQAILPTTKPEEISRIHSLIRAIRMNKGVEEVDTHLVRMIFNLEYSNGRKTSPYESCFVEWVNALLLNSKDIGDSRKNILEIIESYNIHMIGARESFLKTPEKFDSYNKRAEKLMREDFDTRVFNFDTYTKVVMCMSLFLMNKELGDETTSLLFLMKASMVNVKDYKFYNHIRVLDRAFLTNPE